MTIRGLLLKLCDERCENIDH